MTRRPPSAAPSRRIAPDFHYRTTSTNCGWWESAVAQSEYEIGLQILRAHYGNQVGTRRALALQERRKRGNIPMDRLAMMDIAGTL